MHACVSLGEQPRLPCPIRHGSSSPLEPRTVAQRLSFLFASSPDEQKMRAKWRKKRMRRLKRKRRKMRNRAK